MTQTVGIHEYNVPEKIDVLPAEGDVHDFQEFKSDERVGHEKWQRSDPSSSTSPASLPAQVEPLAETEDPTVSEKERAAWQARLCQFHRASGHPTNRNLARVLRATIKSCGKSKLAWISSDQFVKQSNQEAVLRSKFLRHL